MGDVFLVVGGEADVEDEVDKTQLLKVDESVAGGELLVESLHFDLLRAVFGVDVFQLRYWRLPTVSTSCTRAVS